MSGAPFKHVFGICTTYFTLFFPLHQGNYCFQQTIKTIHAQYHVQIKFEKTWTWNGFIPSEKQVKKVKQLYCNINFEFNESYNNPGKKEECQCRENNLKFNAATCACMQKNAYSILMVKNGTGKYYKNLII